MALNKQFYVYSLDTSSFYNEQELEIHNKMNRLHMVKNKLKEYVTKFQKKGINSQHFEDMISVYNGMIKQEKERLYEELKRTRERGEIRRLRQEELVDKNVISIFDSTLTRTIKMSDGINTDIFTVQAYFFDVIEDIILNGFMYDDEKYIVFTASAGNIRQKKTVFIKESVYNKYNNTLTCGLTLDKINAKGGMNVNKYLAYLALCNSATDEWIGFDIRKSIVVDDFETLVNGTVDFIDDKTYTIERKTMDIPIPHMDGCGLCLKDRTSMVRLPFVKGLLVKFPYVKFIKKHGASGIVKDIYCKEHDIIKEDIQYIFTKSQFKMYKFYDSWEEYQYNFIKYNCQAGRCNEEKYKFTDAKINYQMLQCLIDMTDEEIQKIAEKTNYDIMTLYSDRLTMLKVLGVTKENIDKNYMQQALEIYPELLNDTYNKEILKQVKKSLVKDGRAGKLKLDAKYTFLIPDLYAFCEWLFLGIEKPNGLLKDGEVYCKLFEDSPKLDCLRSPSLYNEHAIRNNVVDKDKGEWFVTNGLYTSTHDIISKILMFDVDGDNSLVVADKTVISVAERCREKYDIVPLYYNMQKAPAQILDYQTIYNGLKSAYTGGNIGIYSNNISKIWNSDKVNLDAIKILCMENNFTIDFAKTLYKPERPPHINDLIISYTKAKLPHYFMYAKDKEESQVEKVNGSLVNKLEKIIKNPMLRFTAVNLGKFDYRLLMSDYDFEFGEDSQAIIDLYVDLNKKKDYIFMDNAIQEKENGELFIYKKIKTTIMGLGYDIDLVVNSIVKYLYEEKMASSKTTLWECFGDVIVKNLQISIPQNTILCEKCGVRFSKKGTTGSYCDKCAKEIRKEKVKNNVKNHRLSKKCNQS